MNTKTKKSKIIYTTAIIVIAIISVFIFSNNDSGNNTVLINSKAADKTLLIGDWVRTDGNYIIKIDKVGAGGMIDVKYFNPQPINVESSNWEDTNGDLKIVVVLRDTNYPGSKYTLNYLPKSDLLSGEYYQATENSTFYVEFSRSE